jgi:RHS repeat-associated protein
MHNVAEISRRHATVESGSETDLYYNRARYYDPATGRFLSEDPLRFGADWGSFYRYAYDNSVNFVDPLGMQTSAPVANPPTTGGSPSGPSSPGGPSGGPSSPPDTGLPKIGPEPIPLWPGLLPILRRIPLGLPFWLWPTPTGNDALRPDFPPPTKPPKAPPCKTSKECEKEWEEAFADCAKELAKPHPSRSITGGYNNLYDCARGLVSEACGGNPVGGKR